MNCNGGLNVTRSKQQQAVKPQKLTLCMCQAFILTSSLLLRLFYKYWKHSREGEETDIFGALLKIPVLLLSYLQLTFQLKLIGLGWRILSVVKCQVWYVVDKKTISPLLSLFLLVSWLDVLVFSLSFCAVKLLTYQTVA